MFKTMQERDVAPAFSTYRAALAVSPLIKHTGEWRQASVRRGALRVLKSLPGWCTKKYAHPMLQHLEDEDQHVRNAACRALPFVRLGARWIAEHQFALVTARIKNDALQQAIDALTMLAPALLVKHEDAIRRHATDKHECVRLAVERGLIKLAAYRATIELPAMQREALAGLPRAAQGLPSGSTSRLRSSADTNTAAQSAPAGSLLET